MSIVRVELPSKDTIYYEFIEGGENSVCLDTTQIGNAVTVQQVCENATVSSDKVNKDFCIQVSGTPLDKSEICYALCTIEGICDTFVIILNNPENVNSQNFEVSIGIDTTWSMNDDGLDSSSYALLKNGLYGIASMTDEGVLSYSVLDKNACDKKDEILYQITNSDNEIMTQKAIINIHCDEAIVCNGVSADNDGNNDFLVIKGLERFPENEVFIFNRYGNEVFYAKGYLENEPWRGIDKYGNILPVGVYFYVINLGKGKTLSGYLQLSR